MRRRGPNAFPSSHAATQTANMISGIITSRKVYCVTAKVCSSTAGSAICTAAVLSAWIPSREMMAFLRQNAPRKSISSTGSTVRSVSMAGLMAFPSSFSRAFFMRGPSSGKSSRSPLHPASQSRKCCPAARRPGTGPAPARECPPPSRPAL